MCRQRTLGLLLSFPVTQWRGKQQTQQFICDLPHPGTHGVQNTSRCRSLASFSACGIPLPGKAKKKTNKQKKTEVTHSTQPSMTARWGHCVPGPDAAASPTHVTVIPERHSPLSLCSEDTQPEKRVAGIWGSAGHSVGAVGLQI